MARRAHRQRKTQRPSTPRYLKEEQEKQVEEGIHLDVDQIQMIATPKSAIAQNKMSKKRRVTFADQDEIIVDKKPREKSPEIFEPFEPVSPPRFVAHFVSNLETLTEDEDCEEY